MMPFSSRVSGADPRELEDMLDKCTRDRNLVIAAIRELYPDVGRLLPSELVRDVLRDVCGYGIEERPLPRGQAALCDFGIKRIKLNSRARNFRSLPWQRSYLAHELGHVRLHTDEVRGQVFISSNDLSQGFDDPRFFQKEFEADLYAAVFMVPLELLEKCKRAAEWREELHGAGGGSSPEVWKMVDELAGIFGTTRDLMRYALEAYGWVSFTPARRFSWSGKLELR